MSPAELRTMGTSSSFLNAGSLLWQSFTTTTPAAMSRTATKMQITATRPGLWESVGCSGTGTSGGDRALGLDTSPALQPHGRERCSAAPAPPAETTRVHDGAEDTLAAGLGPGWGSGVALWGGERLETSSALPALARLRRGPRSPGTADLQLCFFLLFK